MLNIQMSHKYRSDYILLIMNCVKYRDKAFIQMDGWLKSLPANISYFHVLGDPDSIKPFYFDWEGNILWVRCKDDYNSLPHKVISAYEAISETFNYKYIFKTDDDQIATTDTFFPMLMKLLATKKSHYGGYLVDVPFKHISKYYIVHPELPKNLIIEKIKYCNGRFYLLSNEAIDNLLSKKESIQKGFLEDYAIGLYLDPEFKEDILFIETQKYFQDGTT